MKMIQLKQATCTGEKIYFNIKNAKVRVAGASMTASCRQAQFFTTLHAKLFRFTQEKDLLSPGLLGNCRS